MGDLRLYPVARYLVYKKWPIFGYTLKVRTSDAYLNCRKIDGSTVKVRISITNLNLTLYLLNSFFRRFSGHSLR